MNMNIIKTFILILLPVIGYSQTLTRLNLAQLAQSGATDGQFIKWNNATSNWVPATVTSSGGTVTSVGLSMPSAFTVTNSPITSSGDITVTGAGTVSQYVRGDGTLANFPNSTGGGASVNYYLNGSVSQGTFGGDTYYEMSKTPILGGGTDFIRTNGAGNGYIASFLTDAGDPSFLNIPGGNWNLEFYFQSSASGGSPQFYGEIYKVSATNVFTLVASGSANPEGITNGTTVDQYFTSIPVPQTSLLITDRLAIRIYVITGGRTITLHTENGNLCEVLTTFTTGLTALNGLTSQVQYFAVGTSGTDFNISSVTDTHTFNLPTASATNRGALSNTDWTTFNNKQSAITLTTTGNSGAATFTSNTLNIPNYTLTGLGGFANPMTTLGDIIYGGTSGAPTRVSGNTASVPQYLYQIGTGTASAAPFWKQITGTDVTGAALTKTDDTNVTLTLGGTPSTALLRAASLTLGWTGQLAVSRGGTGLSSLGAANQYLRVNSGATALEYATFPTIITDHGALTGLAADDHTQYAILAGRGSGQTLQGGTSGSATLQLSSTSNASKGRIHLAFDGGDVWVGGAATASTLRLYSANATNYTGLVAGAQSSDITYTLPITGGTAGQFLSTNGSGTLSWATGATITGTANRIPYYNTSSSLASSGLTWDNTNSRLGINVISPSATLQVGGTSDNSGTYSLYITNQSGDKVLNFDNSGKVGINVSSPTTTLHFNGSMSRKAPVKTGVSSAYTVAETDSWIIFTANANATVTLPTASSFQGREIMIKNVGAYSVVSLSSNVIAIDGTLQSNTPTTTTSILPATAGKWATLVSAQDLDGDWYWAIMQAN